LCGGINCHPSRDFGIFRDLLEISLRNISKTNKPCFDVGNINIDFIKFHQHSGIRDYLHSLLVYNCLLILLLPTSLTKKSSTLIDHNYHYEGYNSKRQFQLCSGNIYFDLSNHLHNFVLLIDRKGRLNYTTRPFIQCFHP